MRFGMMLVVMMAVVLVMTAMGRMLRVVAPMAVVARMTAMGIVSRLLRSSHGLSFLGRDEA
jgi:hypothetical protein